MGSKRLNLKKKEDRISDLPDEIIQHIISFLPSTKEAIQTSILSKRWRKQWTHVPVLIFNNPIGMSSIKFLNFICDTLLLHECSKIKKFHLEYCYRDRKYLQVDEKIRFAVGKDVEELHLISNDIIYELPKFLFNNASLVKLTTQNCSFIMTIDQKVNWGFLTGLNMKRCNSLTDRAMELILSGSPLLKSLELSSCDEFDKLVIASKSLEILVIRNLNNGGITSLIQISCPKLEELKLLGCLIVKTVKLLDLPCLLRATIEFSNCCRYISDEIKESLIKDVLYQLQHVKELIIGSWFMAVPNLFYLGVEGRFSQVLNMKSLTLNDPYFGFISLLRNSPKLEKLVIKFSPFFQELFAGRVKNDWNSNLNNVYDWLVPHLKTIKIIGFPKKEGKYDCFLNFIQFLLKNARALEKMVIKLTGTYGTTFQSKLLLELSSSTKCSQHAVIEVLCSDE